MQLNSVDMADDDQLHCNRECSAAKASLAFHICLPVNALPVAAMIFFLLIKVDRKSALFWYSSSVTVIVFFLKSAMRCEGFWLFWRNRGGSINKWLTENLEKRVEVWVLSYNAACRPPRPVGQNLSS